jgi:hypothetical protein
MGGAGSRLDRRLFFAVSSVTLTAYTSRLRARDAAVLRLRPCRDVLT